MFRRSTHRDRSDQAEQADVITEGALYPHVLEYNKKIFEVLATPLPRPHWPLTCTLDLQDDPLGVQVAQAIFEASRDYETRLIRDLERKGVEGCLVEFGVYRGGRLSSWLDFLDQENLARAVFGFDSFEGLPSPTQHDYDGWRKGQFGDVDAAEVATELRLEKRPHAHLVAGWLADTLSVERSREVGPVAFAMLDVDLYEPAVEALDWVSDLLSDGAVLAFDDWTGSSRHGETAAFFEWTARKPEFRIEFLAAFNCRIYFRVNRSI